MLKLIKYEFRKGRTSLFIMLGIMLGLFMLTPVAKWIGRSELLYISFVLLAQYTLGVYVFVLIRGIRAYSKELKDKTGYLLFMIPKSATAVIASKLLFSLFFALVLLGASALALWFAGTILLEVELEIKGAIQTMEFLIGQTGIELSTLLLFVLSTAISVLSSILVIVSTGYFTVTLKATLQRGGKLRGLLAVVLFIVLTLGTVYLSSELSTFKLEDMQGIEDVMRMQLVPMLVNLSLTALYAYFSALLLKKKVAL